MCKRDSGDENCLVLYSELTFLAAKQYKYRKTCTCLFVLYYAKALDKIGYKYWLGLLSKLVIFWKDIKIIKNLNLN